MTKRRFTFREWEAIEEALCSRLAGERDNEFEEGAPTTEDYESAQTKVGERLEAMVEAYRRNHR